MLLGESRETRMRALAALIVLILIGAAAYAAETITYTYDARGRLVKVAHTGTVNNNVVTNYTYDKANNRNLKNTSGAP
jgi:YD repeat-containing protein